ncbi:adenosine receptor A2b-like [Clavelina lepadiformis]|uniref:G-protein coupled receptors family 1 profile domain-containing protein n=1 Tax=Clavelina lepadiformis TaxID=159417 RepID=A0ABP0GVU8_CLALP
MYAHAEMLAYISIEALIAILTFVSNLLVLVAISKFRNLQTVTNYLIANLAVADIGVALFAIPSAIILRIGLRITPTGDHLDDDGVVNRELCLIIASSVLFLTQVSIYSLFIIALDRFIAIYFPLRYRTLVTKQRVKICMISTWILGGLTGFLPQIGWNAVHSESMQTINDTDVTRCAFEEVINMEYMVYVNFFVCVLLPLLLMFVLYYFIFKTAKNQLRKIYCDVNYNVRSRTFRQSLNSMQLALQIRETKFCQPAESNTKVSLRSKTLKIQQDQRTNEALKRIDIEEEAKETTDCVGQSQRKDLIQSFDIHEEALPTKVPTSQAIGISGYFSNSWIGRKFSFSSYNTSSLDNLQSGEPYDSRYLRRKAQYIKKEFRAARSLLVVVGVFSACWLPLHVLNCVTLFQPDIYQPTWLTDSAIILSHANSAFNPFIYAYHLHDMRVAFQKIIKNLWNRFALLGHCQDKISM